METRPRISRSVVEQAPDPGKAVSRQQEYLDRGQRRVEWRSVTGESDYANELSVRYSEDNGRTWGEWQDRHATTYRTQGGRELIWSAPDTGVWNPVHGHYVALNLQRVFLYDHHESYRRFWSAGEASFSDHSFLWVSPDLKDWSSQLVRFEAGEEFNEGDWGRAGYVGTNESYAGSNLEVLPDGDVVFPIGANVAACCRLRGIAVEEVFPSCPQIMHGLIVVRGRWDARAGRYELTPSRPALISDLESSRGVDEPTVLALANGRLVVVFRGSNVQSPAWRTRIQKGTPAHKWFTFSDDGSATWSDPVPWHFDNGEVGYSPATISRFLRSGRTGRAWWLGNLTGPEAYGNGPRYPLVMAAVSEETGFLERATLAVIDDRDPATESDKLQLSNFAALDDRETGRFEVYLTKLGANPDDFWRSDAYRYVIELG